jgi:hypothetical protein
MPRLMGLAMLCAGAVLPLACGGASSEPAKAAPSVPTPTFSFSETGVSPRSLSIDNGGCVIVHNADTADHGVEPDDLQTCPELVGSTVLSPGHDWDWCGFRGGPKTCAFHDPMRTLDGGTPDPAFSATIQVSAP